MDFQSDLFHSTQNAGIELTEQQLSNFEIYKNLLLEWNKSINLTRIPEDQIIPLHFIDSLLTRKALPEFQNKQLIDIGTGAGFPGLPLKIAFPELTVTLLDSSDKRIHFLKTVIARLKLKDVAVIHGRAEELSHQDKYRGQFDFAVSRAVANLSSLSELLIPFLKEAGLMVALKSAAVKDELTKAESIIQILGGQYEKTDVFSIPGTDIVRAFILINKTAPTPEAYPRAAKKIFATS